MKIEKPQIIEFRPLTEQKETISDFKLFTNEPIKTQNENILVSSYARENFNADPQQTSLNPKPKPQEYFHALLSKMSSRLSNFAKAVVTPIVGFFNFIGSLFGFGAK